MTPLDVLVTHLQAGRILAPRPVEPRVYPWTPPEPDRIRDCPHPRQIPCLPCPNEDDEP